MNARKHWLVQPKNIALLWRVFIAVLALTVLAGQFVHPHASFAFAGWFGFNAAFGLVSCVLMILVARVLGSLLKRRDTYYEKDDVDE